MSRENNKVPRLRFPEFRGVGDWEEKRLGDVAPLQRGFDLPTDQITQGSIPVVYSNGVRNFHSKGMATGPGLVTGRSGTIGKFHFIEKGDYWPHNTSLWVTTFNGNLPKFVFYLYKSIGTGRFSSGSGVPTLNRNYVHAFHTNIPSLPEQQKIADCLSSLDDLITAQTQKLAHLKTHKKGLMQQLFPAEGETLPRLRFPEFRDAGEWEEKKLSAINIKMQSGLSRLLKNHDIGLPVIRSNNIVGDKLNISDIKYWYRDDPQGVNTENYFLDEGDLLVNFINSVAQIGKVALYENKLGRDVIITTNLMRLKFLDEVESKFIFYFFLTEKYTSHIHSITKPAVNQASFTTKDLGKLLIPFPTLPEQQKIADCLSSLDELITAQTQKLAHLKTHKKGLMQQLFPASDEKI